MYGVFSEVLKCVFFMMIVLSMSGGLAYFLEMLREKSIIREIERLNDRVSDLESELEEMESDDDEAADRYEDDGK